MRIELPGASPGGAAVWLDAAFLPVADADRLFAALLGEVPWAQRTIRLFGREVLQPRLLAWMGDPGVTYTYSRSTLPPEPWTPAVREIRARVAAAAAARGWSWRPNGVLLNRYRDGRDAMGWHADDEPELGPAPTIASVSLGQTRRFSLRRRDDHRARVDVPLTHGSLLWMTGPTQERYQHALPRTAKPRDERINLTFRRIC
jgi:alkylated DNA repair dioxygenase AlkB